MKYPDNFLNKVIQGNSLEVMKFIPDNSIDAIITDPPYLKKYLYLYTELAKEAKRILKPGGSYIAIVPHYSLSLVLPEVSNYLKYRWICCMWQEKGSHPRMAMGIEVLWKPIVWWVKDAWPVGRGFVRDGFENFPVNKKHHEWEQSLSWSDYCMKFVPQGGIVLDPFIGSGTTALSCIRSNKQFIGIELDQKYVDISNERIKNEYFVGND